MNTLSTLKICEELPVAEESTTSDDSSSNTPLEQREDGLVYIRA